MTDQTPSRKPGLRDQLINALGQIDTISPVAHRRAQADNVLAVLYREWPWLRAAAEDASAIPAPDREQRIKLDDLTSDQLDGLYDDLDRYADILGEMNKKAVGQAKEVGRLEAELADYEQRVDYLTGRCARAEAEEQRLYHSVRDLHREEAGCCAHCTSLHGVPYPCPTIQALDAPRAEETATAPASVHCPCNGVHFPSPDNCRWCKCHRGRPAPAPAATQATDKPQPGVPS